jgi:Ca-activated chloride channel family protein
MTRPSHLQIQLATTLVFAVVITGALMITKPPPQATCQGIVVASSAEKFKMLQDFAASYNRTAGKLASPCVTVAIDQVNSGDAELALEQGWRAQPSERPDVWAPASSAWVSLLVQRSNELSILPTEPAQSLFFSPLVIGMPQPMADALGYPRTQVGWRNIFGLVKNPAGWGAKGHPLWGSFKLGKTNPTVSTSGLQALIGTYFAAPGGGLKPDRVNSAPVHDFVSGVEAGVVHYGVTAADFLLNLRQASLQGQPLQYVSAVALEEQELVDYNAGIIGGVQFVAPSVPLVAIYPSEGTPLADHPYVILNSAKRAAAKDFFEFLMEPAQQTVVDQRGFRWVGGVRGLAGPALRKQKLIDTSQPTLVLPPPQGAVLAAMLSAWQSLRKRARVLILVDAAADSGLLKQVTSQLADAVSKFNSTDSAGVWDFPPPAGYATPYIPQVPVNRVSSALTVGLRGIVPTSDRSVVAASLKAAIDWMSASYDPGAVNAVLLVEMSPGQMTSDDPDLERYLQKQPIQRLIRVFTVGPSGTPSERLKDFATAGQGVSYQLASAPNLLNYVISDF